MAYVLTISSGLFQLSEHLHEDQITCSLYSYVRRIAVAVFRVSTESVKFLDRTRETNGFGGGSSTANSPCTQTAPTCTSDCPCSIHTYSVGGLYVPIPVTPIATKATVMLRCPLPVRRLPRNRANSISNTCTVNTGLSDMHTAN